MSQSKVEPKQLEVNDYRNIGRLKNPKLHESLIDQVKKHQCDTLTSTDVDGTFTRTFN